MTYGATIAELDRMIGRRVDVAVSRYRTDASRFVLVAGLPGVLRRASNAYAAELAAGFPDSAVQWFAVDGGQVNEAAMPVFCVAEADFSIDAADQAALEGRGVGFLQGSTLTVVTLADNEREVR